MTSGALTVPILLEMFAKNLLAQQEITKQPLIWLQGHTSGMQQTGIWSLPNFSHYIATYFHVLSWTQLNPSAEQPIPEMSSTRPIIVLEGLFPQRNELNKNQEFLSELISNARAVILVGNEAAFNLFNQGRFLHLINDLINPLNIPYIILPGSPVSSRHILGTLNHMFLYGLPEVDEHHRPNMFFSELICDRCEYRGDFENGNFVQYFGEKKGCLFQLGCKGKITRNSCPIEKRNETNSWCVSAGMPCTGCSEPGYPYHAGFGLFGQLSLDASSIKSSWIRHIDSIGKGIFAATTVGLALHTISRHAPPPLESETPTYHAKDDE